MGVIIPNLLDWLDSLVVLDIKQENYDNTAGYRLKVLGQQVLLFNLLDPTGRTVRWNPLSYINRRDPVEVINELQKIAAMLYPDPLTGEKFWAEGARTAFLGITAYIAATVDDGEDALPFTLGEVYRQFAAGDAQRRFRRSLPIVRRPGSPVGRVRIGDQGLYRLVGEHILRIAPVGYVQDQRLAEPLCRCGDLRERFRSQ
ncbi:type IV secretory system conjugative DNA transfer family protein [Sphingomonas aerolata]|uniref:type IV secretory system conjugative DNA transfer family protein n=1 Tax=Sphingomonas aerolata TaxID=185951 RepID=UPI002FE31B29